MRIQRRKAAKHGKVDWGSAQESAGMRASAESAGGCGRVARSCKNRVFRGQAECSCIITLASANVSTNRLRRPARVRARERENARTRTRTREEREDERERELREARGKTSPTCKYSGCPSSGPKLDNHTGQTIKEGERRR